MSSRAQVGEVIKCGDLYSIDYTDPDKQCDSVQSAEHDLAALYKAAWLIARVLRPGHARATHLPSLSDAVRRYIYPALHTPPPGLCFTDQYAFRPTGSTTAGLVAIHHTVCAMLSNNQFVRVFVLDFSKAFDSIRHNLFLRKLSSLSIPDEIYNWIIHFFSERGTVLESEMTGLTLAY